MFVTKFRKPMCAAAVSAAVMLFALPKAFAEDAKLEEAVFAGGCFWCIESDFDKVPGVVSTVSGYTGGVQEDPTYETVSSGSTKHIEAVKITFDPAKTSYEKLLHVFWRSIDPTDAGGQFCDRGHSYTTAVFATSEKQSKIASASKDKLVKDKVLNDPIVTPVLQSGTFYPAEGYHQDYHTKNPLRYKLYRYGCGRDARVKSLWGDEAWGGVPHGS